MVPKPAREASIRAEARSNSVGFLLTDLNGRVGGGGWQSDSTDRNRCCTRTVVSCSRPRPSEDDLPYL